MARQDKKTLNKKYRDFRRSRGICLRCYANARIDPKSGKPQTLCEKHRRENLDQVKANLRKDPELTKAKRQRWHRGRHSTQRVNRYLKWLYATLDRLRDLDAEGDVRSGL